MLLPHDGGRAPRVPLPTYRLQFNAASRSATRARSSTTCALGISDCYASSYLQAVPGSPHGYDVADPTRSTRRSAPTTDYWRWIDALRAHGMGHVLDLVPNHMGIAQVGEPVVAGRARERAELALRALLRHRLASGEGRARRQGADPDPRRSVRRGARAAGAAAGLPRRRVRRPLLRRHAADRARHVRR